MPNDSPPIPFENPTANCPRCGRRQIVSRNVIEHQGIDGIFFTYQLWCLICDTVIGSGTSPKDLDCSRTELPPTVREKKSPRRKMRESDPQTSFDFEG